MTVAELIKILEKQPQDLQVGYRKYSEYCLLEEKDVSVQTQCVARDDGWVPEKRPDKPTQDYLMLPGN